ncbi:MAG: mechanosensitive ion channel [Proteobacteria bacterium]|nr:mechanosensitive ion channel [Pseudomonadota bacterium]
MQPSVLMQTIMEFPEAVALAVLASGVILGLFGRRVLLRYFPVTRIPEASRHYLQLAGTFVFWAVAVMALFVALRILGFGKISEWVDTTLDFVPRMLVSAAIVLSGHLVAVAVADLVRRTANTTIATVGPQIAYAVVMTVSVITALEHAGLNIAFVTNLTLIFVGVALASVALAFAIGARQHVANLLAANELRQYSAGDQIRIGDTQGTVVEINRTAMIVSTEEGLVSIPAADFAASRVTRIIRQTDET